MCAPHPFWGTIFSLIQTLVLTLKVLQRVCFLEDGLLTLESFMLVLLLLDISLENKVILLQRGMCLCLGSWLWVVTSWVLSIFDVYKDEYSANVLHISEFLELLLLLSVSQDLLFLRLGWCLSCGKLLSYTFFLKEERLEGTVFPHAISSHLQAALEKLVKRFEGKDIVSPQRQREVVRFFFP